MFVLLAMFGLITILMAERPKNFQTNYLPVRVTFLSHFLINLPGRHYCLSVGEPLKNLLQSCLLSYLLKSSISCNDVSLLFSAISTHSIHRFRGRPTDLLPSGFHIKYLLDLLSSSILIKCPFRLSLFLSMSCDKDFE